MGVFILAFLRFVAAWVAAAIAHFISLEVGGLIGTL